MSTTAATTARPRFWRRHERAIRGCASCATGQPAARAPRSRPASARREAPWIATIDGDGQNDPADIPRLWDMLNADGAAGPKRVIIGHRKKRRDTLAKRLASRIAN